MDKETATRIVKALYILKDSADKYSWGRNVEQAAYENAIWDAIDLIEIMAGLEQSCSYIQEDNEDDSNA